MVARLQIEGMDEVRAAFRRLGGSEMTKQLGQVHKRIGEIVIAQAGGAQTGIGVGSGATIRPSAATRNVPLRVGGSFRSRFGKWRQWGQTQIFPPPASRPYLIGAAIAARDEINDTYLDGIEAIAKLPMKRS